MSGRNTTHEYRCVDCGVRLVGRELPNGEIKATNWPASDDPVRPCQCSRCAGDVTAEGPTGVAGFVSGRYA